MSVAVAFIAVTGGNVKVKKQNRYRFAKAIALASTLGISQLAWGQALFEHDIVKATASSDDGNVPANAIDGILSTRWSARGLGQTLVLDLASVKDVGSVSIVFYKGAERKSQFTLGLSSDGVNYVTGARLTSALSTGSQSFKVAGKARFVRITGYGNDSVSSTDWNSLSEVAVFAPPVVVTDPTPAPTNATLIESFDGATKTTFGNTVINHRNVDLAPGKGVNGSSAIKVLYVGNSEGSERVLASSALPPALEYTLNFDVQFCSGFDFAKGGKLHGLGPTNPVAGGNSVGDDQWSARGMWGSSDNINTYTYNQNMRSQYGDSTPSRNFTFVPGKYHAVSYHVRVNSPASSANGFMRIYVDGIERVKQENIKFRDVNTTASEINKIMFNTFHGGHTSEWAPRNADGSYKTDCAYYDNFAVYKGLNLRKASGQ